MSDQSRPDSSSHKLYRSTFRRQFVAILKRNYLLKKRNKNVTIQEFLMPLYFVGILGIIRLSISPKEHPQVDSFPEHSLESVSTIPSCFFLFSPDTAEIQDFADHLRSAVGPSVKGYQLFSSWTEAGEFYSSNATDQYELIGIHFDSVLDSGKYTLRFSRAHVPSSDANNLFTSQGQCRELNGLGVCPANMYVHSGFLRLQAVIDSLLVQHLTGSVAPPVPVLRLQMMPKAEYTPEVTFLQTFSAIYFVMAYSVFVGFMLSMLVYEKEKQIKDTMKLMGCRTSALLLAWITTYVVIVVAVTVVVTLLSWAIKLFQQSNMLLVFLLFVLYGFSTISFSFLLVPFFKKAETAGAVGALSTTLFSFAYLAVSLTRTGEIGPGGPVSAVPAAAQWAMSLFAPIAFALGIDRGLYLDVAENGISRHTLWLGEFPLAGSLIMLSVDIILYCLLGLYLDNVLPDAYGQRRSPLFCFMPTYWKPRRHTAEETRYLVATLQDGESTESVIEPVPSELADKNVVRICNVKKSFKNKEKKKVNAVDGISLDIYEGQITCLLGHNGAGKTTLLNILTGLSQADAGTALIYNLDVSDSGAQDEMRAMLGVCPQTDILLPELTCQEHLELFANLKGVPEEQLKRMVELTLADVDLSPKKDTTSAKLSGGQKRKLSLAIALIGNPKVLLLDEPTAGLDPLSRRHVWSLLKDRRKGRVIILTTHFMDEADILADRKAFISKGKLKCAGSSLYLKNRFGLGYHINLVADSGVDTQPITELVQSNAPGALLSRCYGQELTYTLPLTTVQAFPGLLSCVEQAIQENRLGITAYGVSMTTLEEVFLKIGIEEDATEKDVNIEEMNTTHASSELITPSHSPLLNSEGTENTQPKDAPQANPEDDLDIHLTKKELRLKQFAALTKVRFMNIYRHPGVLVFRVIMPVLFMLAGVAIFAFSNPRPWQAQPLELRAGHYVNVTDAPTNPDMVYQVSVPAGSSDWQLFIDELESRGIPLRRISSVSDLITSRPHYLGVDLQRFTAVTSGYDSQIAILYNDSAVHSLPIAVNLISNILMSMATTPGSTNNITAYTFPWPGTTGIEGAAMRTFGAALLLGMGQVQVPASLALIYVRDRETKVRSQLRLSGVTMGMYWICTLVVDLVQLLFVALCAIILILAFKVESLVTSGALLCLVMTSVLYMPLTLMFGYIVSFAFNKLQTAEKTLPNAFTFGALIPYLAVSMMDANGLFDIASTVHIVLCVIDPPYVLMGVIYYVNRVYLMALLRQGTDISIPIIEYFKWSNNVSVAFVVSVLHFIWMPLVLRYLEVRSTGEDATDALCCQTGKKRSINPVKYQEEHSLKSMKSRQGCSPAQNPLAASGIDLQRGDSDVEEELQRVERHIQEQPTEGAMSHEDDHTPVITAHNLRKRFEKGRRNPCRGQKDKKVKVAVDSVSFCVGKGEVLGLLGPNGAGKTTTLDMITAEQAPTEGRVNVGGYDISSNLSGAFEKLGYCPQRDALLAELTLREHLDLYLSLRGYDKQSRTPVIDYYIESLNLQEHADKKVMKLSGGTKRKLSFCISMVGKPAVVLMDEPSSGLDPKSKRFLWDTISGMFASGHRGGILTTHYMEEADALCTRVGILINGKLVCIGSTQHLKNKYGSGYVLEVKLSSSDDQHMDKLHRFVTDLIPDVARVELFQERATYKIAQSSITSLASIFNTIESNKATLCIEDYSFSQATLEQVFLEFAKQQKLEEEEEVEEDGTASQEHIVTVL